MAVTVAAIFSARAPLFPVLKNSLFAGPQKEGFSLLVTNQILRPWGDRAKLAGRPRAAALSSMRFNPSHIDDISSATMNRILWRDAKGYAVPYPERYSRKSGH
jgi:hypothetical protein